MNKNYISLSKLSVFLDNLKNTFATKSHAHSASDITSGTLGTARGGTGLTSSPSMLTNLASTTAANVLQASPRPGVTGTLPIANGGTGATTAAGALTNLGLTATATELNYVDGVTSNIQAQLNSCMSVASNAGAHNSIFRGQYLGSSVTDTQWAEIQAGTFNDLFIGDYWTINGVNWRIAMFDKYLYKGSSSMTSHHVAIVPDTNLYNAKMNDTNITTGGYYNSVMKQTNLATALTTVQSAFGESHILTYSIILDNTTDGDSVTSWSWYNSQIDLMTEEEVYGSSVWQTVSGGYYCVGINYGQLPLFALAPEYISKSRSWWWLRTVRSASHFCYVSSDGYAAYFSASNSLGVRPLFIIG